MAKTKVEIEKDEVKPQKTNLQKALEEINKKHGTGSIRKGRSLVSNVKAWPTSVATLDVALGCGGIPIGRIIEVFGPESAGKTTLALTCIAAAQASGLTAAFVDVEHALDTEWAAKLGVNLDELLLSQPDSAEEALDIVELLSKTGEVGIVVLDSVAALTPQAELDGEIGDSHIGLQARLMSQAMRKLKGECSRTGTVALFINQIREKIGVMYGSNETTPGGRALKFYASVRIEAKRGGSAIKIGDTSIGFPTKAKIVKNKVGPPFVTAEFNIMFGTHGYDAGVDKMESLMTIAVRTTGVFDKSGSWLEFDGKKMMGMTAWKDYVRENPAVFIAIRNKTYDMALGNAGSKSLVEMSDEEIIDEEEVSAAVNDSLRSDDDD